jgi:iron(III) transport system permease protein
VRSTAAPGAVDSGGHRREPRLPAVPRPARRLLRLRPFSLANTLVLVIVAALVLPAIVTLVYSAFKPSTGQIPFDVPGFSAANLSAIFTDPASVRIFANTAVFAAIDVALSLVISTALAILVERTDIPGRRTLTTLVLSPMAVPPVVMAICWTFLANRSNGIYTGWVHAVTGLTLNVYSLPGIVIVATTVAVPSMYLMIAPAIGSVPSNLDEAARFGGVRAFRRITRVTVALSRPVLVSAAIFFIAVAVEAFDIPAILGLPTRTFMVSTAIYQAINPTTGLPDYGRASSYGVILLVVALILVLVYRATTKGEGRFRTTTGRGFKVTRWNLGAFRYVAFACVALYGLVFTAGPVFALVWASLLPGYFSGPSVDSLHRVSLANYSQMLALPGFWAGAENTLVICVVAATASTLIAMWLAWTANRRGSVLSAIGIELSFLAVAVPGLVLAVGLIFLYISSPFHLYGTIWIIVIAYAGRFLSFSTRLLDASFRQLDRQFDDAAAVHGASPLRTWQAVLLPMLGRSLARSWLWVFAQAIREVPMALLLYVAGNETLPVVLWTAWTGSNQVGPASALAVVLSLVSVAITLGLGRFIGLGGIAGSAVPAPAGVPAMPGAALSGEVGELTP